MCALSYQNVKNLEELSFTSMQDFCTGYNFMFEKHFSCARVTTEQMKPEKLNEFATGIIAVNTIQSSTDNSCRFMILFDKRALFSLGGVTIMLPLSRIKDECNTGTEEGAMAMSDAVGEIGNLLIGSFNKIFREGCSGVDGISEDTTLRLQLPVPVGLISLELDPTVSAYDVFTYQFQLDGLESFRLRVIYPQLAEAC